MYDRHTSVGRRVVTEKGAHATEGGFMEWQQIGDELPVEDEKGNRPTEDTDGQARPVELVPYEPLAELELVVDDMARAKDRRWLAATLDNLARQKPASPMFSADFETTLQAACKRFVKGVRDNGNGGREYTGERAAMFLDERLDYDDGLAVLFWLRGKAYLAQSKKKNLKQP